jgi:hypothetical protein
VSKEAIAKASAVPRKIIKTEADLAASGLEPPSKKPRYIALDMVTVNYEGNKCRLFFLLSFFFCFFFLYVG